MYQVQGMETLYLVGVPPPSVRGTAYTLSVGGERIIYQNRSPIFFSNKKKARTAVLSANAERGSCTRLTSKNTVVTTIVIFSRSLRKSEYGTLGGMH